MKIKEQVYTTVINLKRSPDRRKHMEDSLSELNIPFHILEATDGNSYQSDARDSTRLSSGEIGCADSHRRALTNFLESSHAFGLVMEDDIDIDSRFSTNLLAALDQLNANDKVVVQFDYAPVGIKGVLLWWFLFRNLISTNSNSWYFWLRLPVYLVKGIAANFISIWEGFRNEYYVAINRSALVLVHRDRYLAGCYLVSKAAAIELINLNKPIMYPADAVHNVARRQGKIKHYLSVPRVIRQKREIFSSTLNNEHFGKKATSY